MDVLPIFEQGGLIPLESRAPYTEGASVVGFEGVGVEGEALLRAWSGDEFYEKVSLCLAVDVAEPVDWISFLGCASGTILWLQHKLLHW